MQKTAMFVLCALALLSSPASASSAKKDPIAMVLSMIGDLEAKITKAGEAEDKAYKEFFDWCDDTANEAKNAIKEATMQKEKDEALIAKSTSQIEAMETKINELAASIANAEAEIKEATAMRAKEADEFAKVEQELLEGVAELDGAMKSIHMMQQKGSAALLQQTAVTDQINKAVHSLSVIMDAASLSTHDHSALLALVQNGESNDDDMSGAPAGATYEGHGSGVDELIEDMKEKAESKLADTRKEEADAKHNFAALKLSLEDQVGADNHEMAASKDTKAEAEAEKGSAEGDLARANKNLASANKDFTTTSTNCMNTASDHEASLTGRKEELKALAMAKKIVQDATGGAQSQSYSLLQVASGSRLSSRTDLAKLEVVTAVKRLAKEQHSAALAQLASQISAAVRMGSMNGDDVFAKIKTLISNMITKLTEEAANAASEKEYCDEETSKSDDKKAELKSTIDKLTAKIDKANAESADLKSQAATTQKELATLAKLESEMDTARTDENAAYKEASDDLKKGVAGVQGALQVLRDYYGSAALLQQPSVPTHSSSGEAGGSIISMLEQAEADFSKNLAEVEMEESEAVSTYETTKQQNKLEKTQKNQDVKYMTAEAKSLDKAVSELASDKAGAVTEMDAVLEYRSKLDSKCVKQPETYEERKAKREAEINGLKEALTILESEAAFLQKPRHLRRLAPY